MVNHKKGKQETPEKIGGCISNRLTLDAGGFPLLGDGRGRVELVGGDVRGNHRRVSFVGRLCWLGLEPRFQR
jgi:hypothetical protein